MSGAADGFGEELNQGLRAACQAGDIQAVRALLALGADPSGEDPFSGRSAAGLAAQVGSLGALEEIERAGFALGLRDGHGRTALLYAAGGSSVEVFAWLWERSPAGLLDAPPHPPHHSDDELDWGMPGDHPAFKAAVDGAIPILEWMVQAAPELLSARDPDGVSLIDLACAAGRPDVLGWLLEARRSRSLSPGWAWEEKRGQGSSAAWNLICGECQARESGRDPLRLPSTDCDHGECVRLLVADGMPLDHAVRRTFGLLELAALQGAGACAMALLGSSPECLDAAVSHFNVFGQVVGAAEPANGLGEAAMEMATQEMSARGEGDRLKMAKLCVKHCVDPALLRPLLGRLGLPPGVDAQEWMLGALDGPFEGWRWSAVVEALSTHAGLLPGSFPGSGALYERACAGAGAEQAVAALIRDGFPAPAGGAALGRCAWAALAADSGSGIRALASLRGAFARLCSDGRLIHLAVETQSWSALRELVDKFPEADLEWAGADGRAALLAACAWGRLDEAMLLASAGARCGAVDFMGLGAMACNLGQGRPRPKDVRVERQDMVEWLSAVLLRDELGAAAARSPARSAGPLKL